MPILNSFEGATPLEDVSDLIPTHILSRDELNEWEAANILKASRRFMARRKEAKITIEWLKSVHRAMFDDTWAWAGKFRRKNFNIGADWHLIPEQMKSLVDDINFWEEADNSLNLFEQSVRIHHRLVKIHPFINGNGRHARLVSDIFLYTHNEKLPKWPDKELIDKSDVRKKYIFALQAADKGNYKLLETFIHNLRF